jgi:hypothetical protein
VLVLRGVHPDSGGRACAPRTLGASESGSPWHRISLAERSGPPRFLGRPCYTRRRRTRGTRHTPLPRDGGITAFRVHRLLGIPNQPFSKPQSVGSRARLLSPPVSMSTKIAEITREPGTTADVQKFGQSGARSPVGDIHPPIAAIDLAFSAQCGSTAAEPASQASVPWTRASTEGHCGSAPATGEAGEIGSLGRRR